MRKGGGGLKGAEYERSICKLFSRWVSEDQREDLYWRTAMSGGRATLAMKRGGRMNKSQLGDICCIDPEGQWLLDRFLFECKSYKDLEIMGGILHRRGLLHDFWRQLRKRCRGQERHPLLIAHQSYYPSLLITTPNGAADLGLCEETKEGMAARHTHLFAYIPLWNAEMYDLEALQKSAVQNAKLNCVRRSFQR